MACECSLAWVTLLDMFSGEMTPPKKGSKWIHYVFVVAVRGGQGKCVCVCFCVCVCTCVRVHAWFIVISQIIWLHRLHLVPRRDGTFTVFHIYCICCVGGMCSCSHASLAWCYKTFCCNFSCLLFSNWLWVRGRTIIIWSQCPTVLYNIHLNCFPL